MMMKVMIADGLKLIPQWKIVLSGRPNQAASLTSFQLNIPIIVETIVPTPNAKIIELVLKKRRTFLNFKLIPTETKRVKAVTEAKIMLLSILPGALKMLLFKAVGINDKPTQVMIVPPTKAGTRRLIIFWKIPVAPKIINIIEPINVAPIRVPIPLPLRPPDAKTTPAAAPNGTNEGP